MSNNIALKYKPIIWLSLTLVVGALLRFHALGEKSLWWDEFCTLQFAAGHVEPNSKKVMYSPLGVVPALRADQHVPLYFMALNLWIRACGNSEAAMRSLSAIFGIGTIWLIYLVARELLQESTGLVSSFILALAPLHVYYAQEARPYTLEVFLALLTTYFFIKIVFHKENKPVFWLAYMLFALLGVYTHFLIVLTYLFHNLFLILYRRSLFFTKRWLLSLVILALAWLLPFFTLFGYGAVTWMQKLKPPAYWPLTIFPSVLAKFTFAGYSSEIMSISRIAFALGTILFGTLFSLGIVALIRNHGSEKTLFLLMWLCVPILALGIIDAVEKTRASTLSRYLIVASTAYYIILSSGITVVKSKYLRASLLVSVLTLFSLALPQCYIGSKPEQWREAVQYIDGHSPRADLVLSFPKNYDHIINYYAKRPIPGQVIYPGGVSKLQSISKDLNLIFVLIKSTSLDFRPNDLSQLADTLGTYYHLAEVHQWRGVKVLKYDRK